MHDIQQRLAAGMHVRDGTGARSPWSQAFHGCVRRLCQTPFASHLSPQVPTTTGLGGLIGDVNSNLVQGRHEPGY